MIHECRITIDDNIFVAKLIPQKVLKLLDLTGILNEKDVSEFESLDLAIHFLFLAGVHSYNICREIAKATQKKGFDGIIYPSYFSYAKTGDMQFETVYGISIRIMEHSKEYAKSQILPNIALFGRPLKENKVKIDCINRVVINKVKYETTFGPVLD